VKIKILFFGIVRDLVGENSIVLELNSELSIKNFQKILKDKFTGLTDVESFAFAVNEEYVTGDYKLNENDVVAIIPPVSGG
jgi:molybdopterin converting factor subunit 1